MKPVEILIVEDEFLIQNEIRSLARSLNDCKVFSASTGREASQFIELLRENPTIVILDLGLPDVDGFELMKAIAYRPNIAVIIVTARTEQQVRISSLAGGADAFISKPFDPEELLLTISAVRRRVFPEVHNKDRQTLSWRFVPREWLLISPLGHRIRLTAAETQLLDLLHRNSGKAVSRLKIGEELGDFYRYSGNALEATISRLRKKIATIDPNVTLIKVASGTGYIFSADVE
jgi:DNA-binding response OmpR family regulator